MFELGYVPTTPREKLRTEIEQRTTFSLNRCELNLFETHRRAQNVRLAFGGFTITSMLRGKKIVYAGDRSMNYIPGETFLLNASDEMVIDFPEAHYANPTQCTALVIEEDYLNKQLNYINEHFPRDPELQQEWKLNLHQAFLRNDQTVAALSTRLVRLFRSTDPLKDVLVDLKLKELVLAILRLQNTSTLSLTPEHTNERFRAVVEYIRGNITSQLSMAQLSKMACMSKSVFYRTFANEFGMSPSQLLLKEKISYAKQLMVSGNMPVKEVCYASGFSDPNYFSRAFKKIEGMSPVEFKLSNGGLK
ncbi:MAG: helix-turn-helix domain-containing protein [Bacteroidota bacterium]